MTKYVKVAVTTQYNIIRVVKPYRDIGPHLAYDVSADLEASEHDDVGRFPVTSDIPTSCGSGPILCPY